MLFSEWDRRFNNLATKARSLDKRAVLSADNMTPLPGGNEEDVAINLHLGYNGPLVARWSDPDPKKGLVRAEAELEGALTSFKQSV